MTKEWKITFEVKPTDYSVSGYASVLHATIGGKGSEIGDRIPAIWFHKTNGVLSWARASSNKNYTPRAASSLKILGNRIGDFAAENKEFWGRLSVWLRRNGQN